MKALITGHKGYIGGQLFNTLSSRGDDVKGVDLKNGEDVLECLPNEGYDYVFHLSALPRVGYSVEYPSYTLKQNVLVTSKLLEWSKDHGVKRFVFSSSSAAVGDGDGPTSPYGLHKLMSEMECKLYSDLYGLDTVCLRYFNVFSKDQQYGGAYSTVICAWAEMVKQKEPLRIDGDGEQTRDYIHVKDVVAANVHCMNHKENFNGKCFDVGTGVSISVNDIKKIVEKYHKVVWDSAPPRRGDAKHTRANIGDLKNKGWCAKIDSLAAIEECFKI